MSEFATHYMCKEESTLQLWVSKIIDVTEELMNYEAS